MVACRSSPPRPRPAPSSSRASHRRRPWVEQAAPACCRAACGTQASAVQASSAVTAAARRAAARRVAPRRDRVRVGPARPGSLAIRGGDANKQPAQRPTSDSRQPRGSACCGSRGNEHRGRIVQDARELRVRRDDQGSPAPPPGRCSIAFSIDSESIPANSGRVLVPSITCIQGCRRRARLAAMQQAAMLSAVRHARV